MIRKSFIILSISGLVILVIGLILLGKNSILKNKSRLEIIDATYSCSQTIERFYEDDEYIYSFPCVKGSSRYVKYENGNKMLVVDALEEEKVTIDELIDAGLEVYKQEK